MSNKLKFNEDETGYIGSTGLTEAQKSEQKTVSNISGIKSSTSSNKTKSENDTLGKNLSAALDKLSKNSSTDDSLSSAKAEIDDFLKGINSSDSDSASKKLNKDIQALLKLISNSEDKSLDKEDFMSMLSDFIKKISSKDEDSEQDKALKNKLSKLLKNLGNDETANIESITDYINELLKVSSSDDADLLKKILEKIKEDTKKENLVSIFEDFELDIFNNIKAEPHSKIKKTDVKFINFYIDLGKAVKINDSIAVDGLKNTIEGIIPFGFEVLGNTSSLLEEYRVKVDSFVIDKNTNPRLNGSKPVELDWENSTEYKVAQYYKIKNGSPGGASVENGNAFLKHLVERLTPTFSKVTTLKGFNTYGVSPSLFEKLISQGFHTSDKDKNSSPLLKSQSKQVKLSTISTKALYKQGLFKVDDNNKVSIFTGLFQTDSHNRPKHLLLPNVVLGKSNFSVIDDSKIGEVKDINASTIVNPHSKFNNKAVNCLLSQLPLFAPNMYYGVFNQFTIDNETDDFIKISNHIDCDDIGSEMQDSIKNMLNTYFVRLQGVDIPTPESNTREVNFCGRSFSKVTNIFNDEHTVNLTFTLDNYGILLRQFNLMSGIVGHSQQKNYNYYSNFSRDTLSNSDIYPSTFFPSTFFMGEGSKSKKRLDLSIIYNDFRSSKTFNREPHRSSFTATQMMITGSDGLVTKKVGSKTYTLGSNSSYRAYIFEDIKMLGSGKALDFDRDNANEITFTIPCVFKRLKTIDANP